MYHNIPNELRALNQWVCWRYEEKGGRMTKVPYAPSGAHRASIHNPATWGRFDDACATALTATMDGIGFVLTENDPYTGIDIDDKLENPASEPEREAHRRILESFASYTERSVGGRGYHIIIRGKIPGGRDRGHVGVYSTQRYLTFSGDVVRNAPIKEYQRELEGLIAEMPEDRFADELRDEAGHMTDQELFDMALNAVNGEKFNHLTSGLVVYRKDGHADSPYDSQSEADLALLSIIAYYTRDNEQVRRLFRMSPLGKREKATRDNVYIDRTLRKIRGHQPTALDLEAAKANADRVIAGMVPALVDDTSFSSPEQARAAGSVAAATSPVVHMVPLPPIAPTPAPVRAPTGFTLPPGLVGELAQYFYSTAIRPTQEMALAAAIGITAGVAGRCYNISDTGLNQYLLFIARTGTGKEGIEKGIGKLLTAVRQNVPMVEEFMGPSAFASGQGLIRTLDQKPAFLSILGEFGLQLQALSDPRAPANTLMLRKVLLDLYGKSGWSSMLRPTAYSDSEKNTKVVHAPALTIVGESTPEAFFDKLEMNDIADGLVPRFHIIEYKGQRPDRNEHANHAPSAELCKAFANLVSVAVTSAQNHACASVQIDPDGGDVLNAFDKECDAHIRTAHNEGECQLWNRAHLKSMKLAGLLAVGCNPHAPVVTLELAQWAVDFTRQGTAAVLSRFESGDVGYGERKQMSEVKRSIEDYLRYDAAKLKAYKCDAAMHEARVVPYGYLTTRMSRLSCFTADKRGYVGALKNVLTDLAAAEVLVQVSPLDAHNRFKTRQVLYAVGPSW